MKRVRFDPGYNVEPDTPLKRNPISNKKNLTPRQRKYAELRVQGIAPEEAYYLAGFKGNQNHKAYVRRLESDPAIQEEMLNLFDQTISDLENLNQMELMFVNEYLLDNNGSRAVRAAGYNTQHPAQMAHYLLQKDKIKNAIKVRQADRERRTLITGDRLVRILYNWANFDIRKLYRPDGTLKEVKELDEDSARAIQSIRVYMDKRGDLIKSIKLVNRVEPAKMIGKSLGLFRDVIEGTIGLEKKVGVLRVRPTATEQEFKQLAEQWEDAKTNMLGSGDDDEED